MASVTFIAPSVENEFLDKLFAVFGAVKSMKRPVDPSTNKGKAFAFVEYEAPESLKRALKVRVTGNALLIAILKALLTVTIKALGPHR